MNVAIQQEINKYEAKINAYKAKGLRIFASSSFQTHSIPMLHILSQIDKTIPVYFLDTGFHFPETIVYRNQIAQLLGLQIVNISSPISKAQQLNSRGEFSFVSDPDHCCYLNKVLPMESVLPEYDVWISGVRKDQSKVRANFEEEEPGKYNTLRYHPMLNWDKKMIWRYIYDNEIPHHPLDAKGYESVGCEPCTAVRFRLTDDRNGRWEGMDKKECGLHIDLIENKTA